MIKLYYLILVFCFFSTTLSLTTSECADPPIWPAEWDNRTNSDLKNVRFASITAGNVPHWFWINNNFAKMDVTRINETCEGNATLYINSKNCEMTLPFGEFDGLKSAELPKQCLCEIPPNLQSFYRLAVVYDDLNCFSIQFKNDNLLVIPLLMFEEELEAFQNGTEVEYPPRPDPELLLTTSTLSALKSSTFKASLSSTPSSEGDSESMPIWPFIIGAIILLLVIFGIAGFFIYRYYKKSKTQTKTSGTPNPSNDQFAETGQLLKPDEPNNVNKTKTTINTVKQASVAKPEPTKLLLSQPATKPSTLPLQTTQTNQTGQSVVPSVSFNSGDPNAPRDPRFPHLIPGTPEFMAAVSSACPESNPLIQSDDLRAAEFVNSP